MKVGVGTRLVSAALAQWVSGRRTELSGRVFFLESTDHFLAVLRFVGTDDVLIVPEGGPEADPRRAAVIRYSGRFVEPGDEMLVEGRYAVELQDYLAAPFLQVVGLTVVRLDSQAGWRAYLEDAARARDAGVFVEQLVHPAVLLADSGALAPGAANGLSLSRVHVTERGEVRAGPGGARIGTATEPFDELPLATDRLSVGEECLRRAVSPEEFRAAVAERPWLPRYAHALEALRSVRSAGPNWRVSGFGGRLVDGLAADRVEPEGAPLLLWNGTDHLLFSSVTGRHFRVGPDAARIAELLLVTGTADEAAALGVELLRLPWPLARQAAAETEVALTRNGLWTLTEGALR